MLKQIKYLAVAALLGVPFLGAATTGSPLRLHGSLNGLCIATINRTATEIAQPRVLLRLTDVSTLNDRQLIAQVQIVRATEAVDQIKLADSLSSLQTLDATEFQNYCGDGLAIGTEIGQSAQVSWRLKDDSGVPVTTTLLEQEMSLDQARTTGLVDFATAVANHLKEFDGRVTAVDQAAQPEVRQNCSGLMACFAATLSTTPKSARVPVRVISRPFSRELIRQLQTGKPVNPA